MIMFAKNKVNDNEALTTKSLKMHWTKIFLRLGLKIGHY